MKKYSHLNSTDGIQYHILHDGSITPETPDRIRKNPENLNKLRTGTSVTITMHSHRIFPDTDIDSINLKNLVKEAEEKLLSIMDKRDAEPIIKNIKEAQNGIDYRKSLDGLVLYANLNFSAVVKLPIDLQNEVLIDNFFDLRPLYKAIQQIRNYYILAVSRQKIRLMDVLNDNLIMEYDNEDFPFINTHYYTTDPTKLEQDSFVDNLTKEYFNVADKRLQKYLIENPLPVILAGDEKTISYFNEMMDDKRPVIAQVNGSYDNIPFHEIIKIIYPMVELYRNSKNDEYREQINQGESANLIAIDLNDIYNEISQQGNVDSLFISDNKSVKGYIENDTLRLGDDSDNKNYKELILAIMDKAANASGKILFVEDEILENYNGIALIKRF